MSIMERQPHQEYRDELAIEIFVISGPIKEANDVDSLLLVVIF